MTAKGVVYGDRAKRYPQKDGTRIFDEGGFSDNSSLYLESSGLTRVAEVRTDAQDSTDFSAFAWPQLIIKKAWRQSASRFQARLTRSTRRESIICTQSYISVHVPVKQASLLEAACLSLNSMFATYYLLLTSGRFASYRPEPLVMELLAVPVPTPKDGLLEGIRSLRDVDSRVAEAFGLKDAERVLVEDLFNYTLPDFQGDDNSPGRQPTLRRDGDAIEPLLSMYSDYFIRVLRAGFGNNKAVQATIFQEDDRGSRLPFRVIAFALASDGRKVIEVNQIALPRLLEQLDCLNRNWRASSRGGTIYHQRVARIYQTIDGVPTVIMVKPDLARYWTRAAGLSDADDVAADLFSWSHASVSEEFA